jgi:hypothetical protein
MTADEMRLTARPPENHGWMQMFTDMKIKVDYARGWRASTPRPNHGLTPGVTTSASVSESASARASACTSVASSVSCG